MYGSRDTLDKRIYRRRRHRFNSRTVPNLEEPQQVVELAVDVAADGDRALHRVHRALLEHQLLHVLAKVLEVVLWQ